MSPFNGYASQMKRISCSLFVFAGIVFQLLQRRPLFGVPFSCKDSLEVKGQVVTSGSYYRRNNICENTAVAVQRWKKLYENRMSCRRGEGSCSSSPSCYANSTVSSCFANCPFDNWARVKLMGDKSSAHCCSVSGHAGICRTSNMLCVSFS